MRWTQNGARVSLTQKSAYPDNGTIEFEFLVSRPIDFAANFRIPAWADGASVSIKGKSVSTPIVPGTFVAVRREWRNGDRLALELPTKIRLEAIDARHPDTVALLRGPLVLFPIELASGTFHASSY